MVRAMVSAGGVICTTLYDFLVCFVAAVLLRSSPCLQRHEFLRSCPLSSLAFPPRQPENHIQQQSCTQFPPLNTGSKRQGEYTWTRLMTEGRREEIRKGKTSK